MIDGRKKTMVKGSSNDLDLMTRRHTIRHTQGARAAMLLLSAGLALLGCEPKATTTPASSPSGATAAGAKATDKAPAAAPAPTAAKAAEDSIALPATAPKEVNVLGKYDGLKRIVMAPDDFEEYGQFVDLGFRETAPTKGADDILDAFWVYAMPNWYVWAVARDAKLEAPKGADASGKYRKLLKVIHAIDDRARQGGFFDKGFERTPEYKGIRDIPAGYWVYLAPSWYVWEEVHPLPLEAPDEARMQGKYDRLLRVIPAPDEAAKHATLDGGRRTTKAYKGVVDIPPGYWVYTAPNWYVWGVSNEAEPPPKEEKKTATSKTPVKKRGLVPPPKKKAQ